MGCGRLSRHLGRVGGLVGHVDHRLRHLRHRLARALDLAGLLLDGEIDGERAATEISDYSASLYEANRDDGPPREIQDLIDEAQAD